MVCSFVFMHHWNEKDDFSLASFPTLLRTTTRVDLMRMMAFIFFLAYSVIRFGFVKNPSVVDNKAQYPFHQPLVVYERFETFKRLLRVGRSEKHRSCGIEPPIA
jgi:hypothetical protein